MVAGFKVEVTGTTRLKILALVAGFAASSKIGNFLSAQFLLFRYKYLFAALRGFVN
jgi:hypothetical protein